MSKTIDDLREHLFAVIAGVRDKSVTIEQARAINDTAQVIVNLEKVEVDYLRVTERGSSAFLGGPASAAKPANGIVAVRQHLLRDE